MNYMTSIYRHSTTGSGLWKRVAVSIAAEYRTCSSTIGWNQNSSARSIHGECSEGFRAELETPGKVIDLEEWCRELKADGEFFLRWQTTNEWDGDVETIFHGRRRAIDIGVIWPVLLALHRSKPSPEDLGRCLRVLDSFLWRRAIVGWQARGYDAITMDLLKALPPVPTGDMPFSNAIINKLSDYVGPRFEWPKDDEVRKAVLEKKRSNWANRQVLEAVERGLMQGRRGGNKNMAGNLPIEHLMPQGWQVEDWPLPANVDEEEAKELRKDIIQRLGNLTLVEHGLNSKLGNRPWAEKRKILQEEDNLYINKDLLSHAPDDYWDEEQIRLRGERLAAFILTIWPHGHEVVGEIERLKA